MALSFNFSVNTQVYERRVTYKCTCYNIEYPSGGELAYAWYWQGHWRSGERNPTFTIDDGSFSPGRHYETEIKCVVSCQYQEIDSEGNLQNPTISASGTLKIDVYTHPGAFYFNASSDKNSDNNIIANVLTVDKINRWAEHFNKAYHWYYQSGNNYSDLKSLKVFSGDLITAKWYNNCAIAMGEIGRSYTTVTGGNNGTVISAQLINDLNFYGQP